MSILMVFVTACDGRDGARPDASAPSPSAEAEATLKQPAPKQAEPVPAMLPAPQGTVAIDRRYVHTCRETAACPKLLQDAGAKHCSGLTLGGLSWRLPTFAELQDWRGNDALAAFDGFHWSASAWEEDPAQFWIFDPGSGSKTTARPDRKPFTIRCVAEPN